MLKFDIDIMHLKITIGFITLDTMITIQALHALVTTLS